MQGIISSVQSLGTVDGPGVRTVVFSAGCPLRCAYCHNPETWEMKGERVEHTILAEKILRFKPYIKNGGVTLSGGEPLMQGAFFAALAEKLKSESLSVALDTSGNYTDENTAKLLSLTNLVLLDVKFNSEEEYRRRLDCCRRCEQLSQGLCRLCGCFVEARAAGKNAFCPHVPGCW